MLWVVILMALAIPLAVVVLDSPPMRALVDRAKAGSNEGMQGASSADMKLLAQKVDTLESELENVNRDLAQLKESQQFLQQMLEDPARTAPKQLPKPPA